MKVMLGPELGVSDTRLGCHSNILNGVSTTPAHSSFFNKNVIHNTTTMCSFKLTYYVYYLFSVLPVFPFLPLPMQVLFALGE